MIKIKIEKNRSLKVLIEQLQNNTRVINVVQKEDSTSTSNTQEISHISDKMYGNLQYQTK